MDCKIMNIETSIDSSQTDVRIKEYYNKQYSDVHFLDADIIVSHYDFLEVIGKGSQGRVIKAVDKHNGMTVAIKITEESRNSIDEVLILSTLDHPHILKVNRVYKKNGLLFIVMDYYSRTLSAVIDSIPIDEIACVMAQLLDATHYLKHNGIIHRDLKPDNIVISTTLDGNGKTSYSTKIIDFGMAILVGVTEKKQRPAGTLFYMSPELISNDYDQRTDLWSLGVILFQLITKRHLFKSSTQRYLLAQILNFDTSLIQNGNYGDEGLQRLLKGLLEPNPDQRMSAEEALDVVVLGRKLKYLLR